MQFLPDQHRIEKGGRPREAASMSACLVRRIERTEKHENAARVRMFELLLLLLPEGKPERLRQSRLLPPQLLRFVRGPLAGLVAFDDVLPCTL